MVLTPRMNIPPPTVTRPVAITKAFPAHMPLLRVRCDIADISDVMPGDVESDDDSDLKLNVVGVVARATSLARRSDTVVLVTPVWRRRGGGDVVGRLESWRPTRATCLRLFRCRRTISSGMAMATLVPMNYTLVNDCLFMAS
jgi:hypothetical protein